MLVFGTQGRALENIGFAQSALIYLFHFRALVKTGKQKGATSNSISTQDIMRAQYSLSDVLKSPEPVQHQSLCRSQTGTDGKSFTHPYKPKPRNCAECKRVCGGPGPRLPSTGKCPACPNTHLMRYSKENRKLCSQ